MKLRRSQLFLYLVPLSAIAGFTLAPIFYDYDAAKDLSDATALVDQSTDQPKKATKADKTADNKSVKVTEETPLGKKEKVDLAGLFEGSGTEELPVSKPKTIVATPVEDASENVDPSSFADASAEDTSVEDTKKRLNHYKNSLSSSTDKFEEVDYTGSLSPVSWRNPGMLKKQLAGRIRSSLPDLEPSTIEAFLREPANRLMIVQWELLNRADTDELEEVMKGADFGNDMQPLLNNLPWLGGMVYDGELSKVVDALKIMHHLRQSDANMDKVAMTEEKGEMLRDEFIKRRIAGAVAAEFSNNGWFGGEEKELTAAEIRDMRQWGIPVPKTTKGKRTDIYKQARERYFFFAEGVDQRLMNSDFYDLPNWLLRFPCGWKVGSFGTKNTMEWHRANNSCPAEQYKHLLDHVPYMIVNVFGDPIAGPHYYQPTECLYPDNHNKHVRDIGAVCGGQGCYSASGAASNGIPAMIMFEPGHCSFTVYVNGKWEPCNSGSPIRFPSWRFWNDSAWSSLMLYTEMYQDGRRTRDAQLIASLADLLTQNNNPINGLALYELSIAMQPLNRPTWDAYVETAVKNLTQNPKRWLAVNDFLCMAMAPTNPSACATFLQSRIYPSMLKDLRDPRQKLVAFNTYFESLKTQEETPWDELMRTMMDLQHKEMGKTQALQLKHYEQIVETVCAKPKFGVALTWAIENAYLQNRAIGDRLMETVEKNRESSPDKELVDAAIIRAAENIGNASIFNKYSKPYLAGIGDMPEFEKPKGNLVSAGGLVHLETYADDPRININHAAALTEKGGELKTRGGAKEKLTLILPESARIGTIIIVPTCGNCVPYFLWEISISRDGKKWEQLAALPDKSDKPFIKLQINKQHPSAKYIRIDSGEAMTYGIQFRAFLVYDNKNQ